MDTYGLIPEYRSTHLGDTVIRIYTYAEAHQNLASLLEEARTKGEVRIKRRDGQLFVIKPEVQTESPLNVPGINLGLGREEIVTLVREGRARETSPTKRK